MKHCPLHHVTYVLAKMKLQRPMVKEMHYQGNALFDLDPKSSGSRSHKVTSTLDTM